MTRCYICDMVVEEFKVDPRDHKIKPCGRCEAVVTETFRSYEMDDETEDEEFIHDLMEPLEEFLEHEHE